jgi:hypothetical protein
MGSHAHDLNHASDGALFDQLPGANTGFDVQALAVIDHVFAPGALGDGASLGELIERGEGRLVGEVIFPGLHDPAAERAAFVGNGGGGDEMDIGLLEQLIQGSDGLRLRIFLAEFLHFCGIRIEDVTTFPAGFGEALGLAVDMAMIEGSGSEDEFSRADDRGGLAHRGVIHAIRFLVRHWGLIRRETAGCHPESRGRVRRFCEKS